MKKQAWLNENKAKLIADIPDLTIHSQIHGSFSVSDIQKINEIVETFETLDEDLSSEDCISLFISDCVYRLDEYTIQNIIDSATHEELNFNLQDDFMDNVDSLFNSFKEKLSTTENYFIIASPMLISMLQAARSTKFLPSIVGDFKGRNNTMLVGTIVVNENNISIYSYISIDKEIIGYKDPNTGKIIATAYTVNNITF